MTYQEPERLALQLRELMERRATLRAILQHAITRAMTDEERADIQRVICIIDKEMADLEKRLASLRSGPSGGN